MTLICWAWTVTCMMLSLPGMETTAEESGWDKGQELSFSHIRSFPVGPVLGREGSLGRVTPEDSKP